MLPSFIKNSLVWHKYTVAEYQSIITIALMFYNLI